MGVFRLDHRDVDRVVPIRALQERLTVRRGGGAGQFLRGGFGGDCWMRLGTGTDLIIDRIVGSTITALT